MVKRKSRAQPAKTGKKAKAEPLPVQKPQPEPQPEPKEPDLLECCICFDGDPPPIVTSCGHPLHAHCMMKWSDTLASRAEATTCPVCRRELSPAPRSSPGHVAAVLLTMFHSVPETNVWARLHAGETVLIRASDLKWDSRGIRLEQAPLSRYVQFCSAPGPNGRTLSPLKIDRRWFDSAHQPLCFGTLRAKITAQYRISVSVHQPPAGSDPSSFLTQEFILWHLHAVAHKLLSSPLYSPRELAQDVQRLGVVEALLRWKAGPNGAGITIKGDTVRTLHAIFGEPALSRWQDQCLNLCDRYELREWSTWTALPAAAVDRDFPLGIEQLLRIGLFVRQTKDGVVCYKSAAVVNDERRLLEALNTIRRRAADWAASARGDSGVVALTDDLQDEQRVAAQGIMDNPVSVIDGKPGTGKSFTVACVAEALPSTLFICPSHASRKVVAKSLMARDVPNARAEVLQFLEYVFKPRNVWHRRRGVTACSRRGGDLLRGLGVDVVEAEDGEGEADLVHGGDMDDAVHMLVLDETSMQSLGDVAGALTWCVRHFPSLRKIVFCGDPKQLKSVGRGNVLNDVIRGGIPHFSLRVNRRSSGALSTNLDNIIANDYHGLTYDSSFVFRRAAAQWVKGGEDDDGGGGGRVKLPLDALVREFMEDRVALQEPHVITYQKNEARAINVALEERILGRRPHGLQHMMRPGLKVEVLTNALMAHGLNKRDLLVVAKVREVGLSEDGLRQVYLELNEWSGTREEANGGAPIQVTVPLPDVKECFGVGYATTGHSAQGGQMSYVHLPVTSSYYYDSHALYTNASRAQTRVKIFGDPHDLHTVVSKTNELRRSNLWRFI